LEESADLIYVTSCARQDYGSLTKVQRRANCRFFIIQFMVLGCIPGETLCKEVELEALVHVKVEPHVNKPPGTPQAADGLTEQEFLSYLVEEMVGSAKQVSAKR